MNENGTKNNEEVLVCHIEGLKAYSSDKTPVSKIPSNLPQWKQELLRKKEKDKMEKYKAEMARLYEESQTPEWMKPLKELHQRRKSEQSEKEEAERRKAEEERQRFEAMPAWKKKLIYKKRAKSAENLLSGCNLKILNKSEVNSERNGEEDTENIQAKESDVNAGQGAETKYVDDGISDNEKRDVDEDTINGEVEKTVDEIEKEEGHDNREIEPDDTIDDVDHSEDHEGHETEVDDKTDEVHDSNELGSNNDERLTSDNEENDNQDLNDELQKEISDKSDDDGQVILGDDENKDESKCIKDENGTEEIGDQQIAGSRELAEVENRGDKNGQ